MEQDYNTKKWSRSCPNVDCRKSSSDCGIKYVFISSVLGDDQPGSKVAPKNGAYSNTIVYYEANGAVYIYSSEGIPVETNISDAELLGEIKKLAEEKADKTEIPTKLSQLLNDTGYITRTVDDLANYYTKTVTNGLLSGKADKTELPTKLSQLLNDTGYITRTVANLTNYYTKSATNELLSGKADKNQIPTKTSQLTNDSGYITGINNSDVINALGYTPYDDSNPDGYTTNIGTVTSVNNTQPDANGNVTISIPTSISDLTDDTSITPIDKADTLTGLTASITELNYCDGVTSDIQTQLNGKQDALISGTNIKTINNTTILGSGDIDTKSIAVNTLSGTAITLTDNSVNTLTPTGNTTFTLPTVTDTTVFHQILVQLNLTTVYTIALGTSTYFGGTAPDLSATGNYNLIYEYDNALSAWVVGCIEKGA